MIRPKWRFAEKTWKHLKNEGNHVNRLLPHQSFNRCQGIESAVALKNGYALGIALTVGLNQKEFGIESELHFNSQAAVFYQAVKEMYKLLEYQHAASLENISVGAGDLYVTVYGGRTRLVGILLGRGLDIDKAKEELNGVTLESLVVAERVARAKKISLLCRLIFTIYKILE